MVDRKLVLLVGELKRHRVSVAGVQESKWFGSDVWPAAEGYTFLHSGRPLPDSGDPATRNGFFWMRGLLWHGDRVVRCGRQLRLSCMTRLKWIGRDVGVI